MIKKFLRRLILQRRYPLAVIDVSSAISLSSQIGNHAVIFKNAKVVDSSIERYTYLQDNAFIFNANIGPFGSIGANVSIGLVNHPIDLVSTSPVFYDCSQPLPKFFTQSTGERKQYKKTIIGADVWIGDGVKIIEGIEVGVGSVIGAGSVVTKEIPPFMVAAGNPCRIIRSRFNDSICSALLASKWWELDNQSLIKLTPFFSDPVKFLDELGNL